MNKDFDIGTKRINSASRKLFIKASNSWDYLDEVSEALKKIISQYSKNKKLKFIYPIEKPKVMALVKKVLMN